MNSALEDLRKTDPRLFKKFVDALQQDLGMAGEPLTSFECPACHTRFDVNTAMSENVRMKKLGMRGLGEDSLLELLLELARLKKATTGKIHLEFNKSQAEKIKGLKPPQIRQLKREWLRSQVAKYRKSRSA